MALIQVNFMSKALMRTVTVNVILPVDKFSLTHIQDNADKKYKTLYLLHGIFGNYTDWISGTNIQRLAEAKDLAVVMPSGENGFYLDQPIQGRLYATFIGDELVEITRRMFPLSRKKEDTFIGGLSMGGYGAIRNGLKYNDTFGAIIGLSSALHILEDVEANKNRNIAYEESCFGDLKEAVASDKNPRVLIEQLATGDKAKLPRIFMACGTEDGLIDVNRVYRDLFKAKGFDITYHECKGNHNWDFWSKFIQTALEWLPLEHGRQGVNSGNVSG